MAAYMARLVPVTLIFLTFLQLIESQDNATTLPSTTTISTTITTTAATTTTTQAPTQPSSNLPANTDLAICTCDLTANGCDVNCCCDTNDCSAEDISTFSKCIDNYTPPDRQACVKRSIMFRDNVPFEKNETDPNLFCVIRDNYSQRNYYDLPNAIETPEKFAEYQAKYGGLSYKPVDRQESLPTDFYKSGDPIFMLYSSKVLGKLGLPRAMLSKECVDSNPAAFLYDQTFECVRPLVNIERECETTPALSAEAYYKDFKIIKNPKSVADEIKKNETREELTTAVPVTAGYVDTADSEVLQDIYNSSLVVGITLAESHTCTDRLGISRKCNFTSDTPDLLLDQDGTMYCGNAIIKVEYMLEYNGTAGISAAQVQFTFAELSDRSSPPTQTFSTSFKKMGDNSKTFERSGNPGYQIGQPILAGNLTSTVLIDDSIRYAIEVNADRDNWLTIVKSLLTGRCDDPTSQRLPVTFGENLRSGCNLELSYYNLTSGSCRLLQDYVIQVLLGDSPPTHTAVFGNTSPENTGDWVKIMTENQPEGVTDASGGGCLEISLGLHIQVMYANVGALGNPQPKVIGVNYKWEEPQDIFFQCSGPYCTAGSEDTLTQDFEIVSSVSFIDASNKANGEDAAKPQFTAKLPEDFFYPFT